MPEPSLILFLGKGKPLLTSISVYKYQNTTIKNHMYSALKRECGFSPGSVKENSPEEQVRGTVERIVNNGQM